MTLKNCNQLHKSTTGFSGHSLRAGFASSAAKAGIQGWKIRAQTGHASDAMLSRYIRDSEQFVDNAAGGIVVISVNSNQPAALYRWSSRP